MQVSIQLIYMSCFPQPFDKIIMCSLQINHCLSQSLSLSECFEHNFILLSIDWLRNVDRLKKTFQAAGHFYLSIYLFIFLSLFILLLSILLLVVVGDIPFSGDFNKSAVRWDQNKLFY